MRGAAVCTTGGVPCNRNTPLTGCGSAAAVDVSLFQRLFLLKFSDFFVIGESSSIYFEFCEDVMAGRQACFVRTKSRSVDMKLETKPDDYSLEIGDGGGVRVSQ